MNRVEQTLTDVLQSREERVAYQKQLLAQYRVSLISFKLNIPGKLKDSDLYRAIFREGLKALTNVLQEKQIPINFRNDLYKSSGPESYIVLARSPQDIKTLTTHIEDQHPLGRIFDFDVLDPDGRQVSRVDLGFEPRKCFICNQNAFECARFRKHSVEEMIQWIERKTLPFFAYKIQGDDSTKGGRTGEKISRPEQ